MLIEAKPIKTDGELKLSFEATAGEPLAEGYRKANKRTEPLPLKSAFVLEMDMIDAKSKTSGSPSRIKYEFHAVFQG